MSAFLTGLVLAVELLVAPGAKDRPCMEAQVNDHPIRLQIDTGAEDLMMFGALTCEVQHG